jgi:hypothetical protein
VNRATVNSLLDAIGAYEKALGGEGVRTSPWNVLSLADLTALDRAASDALATLTKSIANYPVSETPPPLLARIEETKSWLDALRAETAVRGAHPAVATKVIRNGITVSAARAQFSQIDAFDGKGTGPNFQRNLALQVNARLLWNPSDASLMVLKDTAGTITPPSVHPDRPRPPPDDPPGGGADGFKRAVSEYRSAILAQLEATVQRNPGALALARARARTYGEWLRLAGVDNGGSANGLSLVGTEDLTSLREGYRRWYAALVSESQSKPFDSGVQLDLHDAAAQLHGIDNELRGRLIASSDPSLPDMTGLGLRFARGPPKAIVAYDRAWKHNLFHDQVVELQREMDRHREIPDVQLPSRWAAAAHSQVQEDARILQASWNDLKSIELQVLTDGRGDSGATAGRTVIEAQKSVSSNVATLLDSARLLHDKGVLTEAEWESLRSGLTPIAEQMDGGNVAFNDAIGLVEKAKDIHIAKGPDAILVATAELDHPDAPDSASFVLKPRPGGGPPPQSRPLSDFRTLSRDGNWSDVDHALKDVYKAPGGVIVSPDLAASDITSIRQARIDISSGQLDLLISQDHFEEASKANRDDVEYAMAGDARSRREFYLQQKKEIEQEHQECKLLTPQERGKPVILGRTITADGIIVESKTPRTITRGDYCDIQIPQNTKLIDSWISDVDSLVKKIQDDRDRREDSKIERMNYATLVDSMLRGWRLPVARSQAAFDYWRDHRRGPAWASIRSALGRLKVDPEILSGENMIFSVRAGRASLEIRPVQVLDLAHAVVVVDPAAGATRLVDAWNERTLHTANGVKDVKGEARAAIDRAVASCSRGDAAQARKELIRGLSLDPTASLTRLEESWTAMFRDDRANVAAMTAKIQPAISAIDHEALLEALADDPRLKDNFAEYLRAYWDMLKGDPDLPIDFHLKLAVETSDALAEFQQELQQTAAAGKVSGWDVLETYADASPLPASAQGLFEQWRGDDAGNLQSSAYFGRRLESLVGALKSSKSLSTGDRYRAGRIALATEIMEDPATVIRESIGIVRKRDPAYFQLAESARGIPKTPSQELTKLDEVKKIPLSLFEDETLVYERTRALMARRALAVSASAELWSSDDPQLPQLLQLLDDASKEGSTASNAALVSARDRIDAAVRGKKKLDTLARAQLASVVDQGARQILLRATLDEDPEAFHGLRDHSRLDARVEFESIHYASAFNSLFPPATAVALYHPSLKWQVLAGDSAGPGHKLSATVTGGDLLICSPGGQSDSACVLRLAGLAPPEAADLADKINAIIDSRLTNKGKLSDRVLMLQVHLRPEAAKLLGLVSGDAERLAIVKAMVYSDSPPARDLVPAETAPGFKPTPAVAVETVTVPSLEQTKRLVKTRFHIQ